MDKVKIVGLCGSLRKDSYNRKLLEYAQKTAPENVEIKIVEIKDLPFFNEDIEHSPGEAVTVFKREISEADAILFATPEYNHSIPAVLKNAIEWGSRPHGAAVMTKKPAAVMGASTGIMGTGRAQIAFREIAVQVDINLLHKPEVVVTFAKKKFEEAGVLTDEKTQTKVVELVKALGEYSQQGR